MKKLLSLFLSLIMLLALATPVMAAGTDYEDFLADFDRWWAEDSYLSDYFTLEELQESYGFGSTEAMMEYLYEMWQWYAEDRAAQEAYDAWKDEYLAAHPNAAEELRMGAYDYFAREYSWYDSADQYMEWWELTEEEFLDEMVNDQLYDLYSDRMEEESRREFITEHGGTPGELGLMVNGKYLTFPEVRPLYAQDGAIWADAQTLSQALGVQVSGDERGYALVKDAVQAAGYRCFWDGAFNTGVVIWTDALAAEIDKDFTILKKAFARQLPQADSYQVRLDCAVDATVFNSLDGDQQLDLSYAMDVISSQAGLSGTVKYDFSALLALMSQEEDDDDLDPGFSVDPMAAIMGELMAAELELRMDMEGEMIYLSYPAFNDLLQAGSVWLSLPMEDMDMLELVQPTERIGSFGEYIVSQTLDDAYSGYHAVYYYDDILESAAAAAELFGDGCFVRQGTDSVLTMDKEALEELLGYYSELKLGSMTITVHDDGTMDLALELRVVDEYGYGYMADECYIAVQGTIDGGDVSMSIEFHLKNRFKCSITLEQQASVSDKAPELTPPKGTVVLPLDGMI